ncbi:MAG: transporter substrate-binding domain-containing protein, partial [Firmicutes bacterium]|nr:transporter substrate-binding domain-containing protein [Bacillota bacterium]
MKKIKSSGTAVSRAFRKALSLTLILAVLMGAITAVAAAMPMESKNGITEINQLDGKNIGVQTGVLYEDAIKDDIDGETWLYYKMPNDMIPALEAGRIDAYLIEEVGFVAQRYEHPELMRLEEKAGVMEFAVIVGNNDKQSTL